MPRAHFLHVETWVFDLDNTLYPPQLRLFDQIERRMTAYVMAALGVNAATAEHLRDAYWRSHGTTLAGLMAEHALAPEPYLADVHDIDLAAVTPAPRLAAAIAALPGRKIVYTNGSREHARRVTAALGLAPCLDALYGFEDAGFAAKPRPEAYARVFAAEGLVAARAAMFEDDPRNLEAPHALGLRTVLVGPAGAGPAPAHVHHRTEDLADFLTRLA
jgi:putative hydrolase of the HAD superfamily